MFKEVRFMTVQEKESVLRAWRTFVKYGFLRHHFTQALYHHLMQHCSFIAHYDLGGFYATYFRRPADTLRFLDQFDESKGCRSVEYGDSSGWLRMEDYADINQAMIDAIKPFLSDIRLRLGDGDIEEKWAAVERAKADLEAALRSH